MAATKKKNHEWTRICTNKKQLQKTLPQRTKREERKTTAKDLAADFYHEAHEGTEEKKKLQKMEPRMNTNKH